MNTPDRTITNLLDEDGEVAAQVALDAGEAAGFSPGQMRAACKRLGLKKRQLNRMWLWFRPEPEPQPTFARAIAPVSEPQPTSVASVTTPALLSDDVSFVITETVSSQPAPRPVEVQSIQAPNPTSPANISSAAIKIGQRFNLPSNVNGRELSISRMATCACGRGTPLKLAGKATCPKCIRQQAGSAA